MTANELLDKLRSASIKLLGKETEQAGRAIILYRESAIMLQQQAKEIAMLKQIIDANNLQSNIGQFIRPIDEPVAHRFKWEEQEKWQYGDGYDATGAPNDPDYFAYEPLYTHPPKELDEQFKEGFEVGKEEGWKAHKFHHPAKTLTDGEILNIYLEQTNGNKDLDILEFAKLILKKAGEK